MRRPSVVVFDVNGTLSDLSPMAEAFEALGAPGWLARVWFASLLRDGFALAATGTSARFADIGASLLRNLLSPLGLERATGAAVDAVMSAFTELPVHDDVPAGVSAMAEAGIRLVTLTNGSVEVGERLLSSAGIRSHFERLLSVEQAGVWKPAAGSYAFAARSCGTEPSEMMLVAAHPWDIDGAKRAGLHSAWVNRENARYPDHFTPPDETVPGLLELAVRLCST